MMQKILNISIVLIILRSQQLFNSEIGVKNDAK